MWAARRGSHVGRLRTALKGSFKGDVDVEVDVDIELFWPLKGCFKVS